MSCKPKRKGVALLMTLFVICIVSLVLAGLAGHSLSVTYEAGIRQQELQLKWGRASCERVMFQNAKWILGTNSGARSDEGSVSEANRIVQNQFILGGYRVLVVLQDESAKLDLNLAAQATNVDSTTLAAKNLIGDTDVRVGFSRTDLTNIAGVNIGTPIQSWDQFLVDADGRALPPEKLLLVTRALTLWGGRINIRTAPDNVIVEAASIAVGPTIAQRLVDARNDNPAASIAEILAEVGPTERQFVDLARLFGDESTSRSVFTLMERDGRAEISLVIERAFSDNLRRYFAFSW